MRASVVGPGAGTPDGAIDEEAEEWDGPPGACFGKWLQIKAERAAESAKGRPPRLASSQEWGGRGTASRMSLSPEEIGRWNDVMKEKAQAIQTPTLWQRFLLWLEGGKRASREPERIKVSLPGSGNTDVILSSSQRKRLEDAMSGPADWSSQTSVYSRDTTMWRKASGKSGDDKSLIL